MDMAARQKASQLFRDFISGNISNDAFEDQIPITHDRAIDAVWSTSWVFYDDFKEHKLEGRDRLPPDQKRACIRWLLFLQSDLLYEWPAIYLPGMDPVSRTRPNFWRRLISSHKFLDESVVSDFINAGHYPVWPFISVRDYKQAISNPLLLSGKSNLPKNNRAKSSISK